MAALAAGFWGPVWAPWTGEPPGPWLKGYKNRIVGGRALPLPTLLHFEQAIASSNDSAPGPDGIPYVAYRLLCDLATHVLRNVLVALSQGATPPLALMMVTFTFPQKRILSSPPTPAPWQSITAKTALLRGWPPW